jgi:alpha-tubulin suppressor-like RCC1 family protein
MQWRSARTWQALVPALLAALSGGCSDDNGAVGPRIATMVVVSGNGQTGAIGAALPQQLVVRVEDQRGDPIAGAVINWQVTSGTGLVSPRSDTTNADGFARTTFRLGSSIGVQTVSATLAGLSPVSFTANATAAPASKLTATGGDAQTGDVGRRLATDLSVLVTDAFDNPKAGIPVSFTVITGGGSVSAATVVSNASGVAKVSWTLGTTSGVQSVLAGSGAIAPLTFTATANPDSPVQFLVLSGNDQAAGPGTTLPDSLVVRLVDQYGNGVPGVAVNWTLGPTDGSVSPATTVTNATGRAAVRWTLGPTGGPKAVTARAGTISRQLTGAAFISYQAVAAGGRHTCGLAVGGELYCWGFNGDAELGVGQLPQGSGPVFASPMPVATTGNWTFRDVSAGTGHTCAVVLTGAAFCWGSNVDGRIGQESHTTERFTTPQQVRTTYTFTGIVSGRAHNCGIGFSTRPVCWGSNHEGEIGVVGGPTISVDSSTIDFPNYVNNPVFGLGSVSISAGGVHTCSVSAGGTAHCWGSNVFGQLGDGSNTRAPSPVAVASGASFTAVAAGGFHTCALTSTGAALCWGRNASGQLGNGAVAPSNVPVAVTGGLVFTRIVAGTNHSCGLTAAGAAFCWGRNASGQLGDGSTTDRSAPAAVGGGLAFRSLSAGEAHTCGVTTGNVLHCWGDNQFGALGDGTTTNRLLPARVRFQP